MDTLGGTCCNSSFILGTRLTALPLPATPFPRLLEATGLFMAPLVDLGGGTVTAAPTGSDRPLGVARGGADNIDVKDGVEAARDDILG